MPSSANRARRRGWRGFGLAAALGWIALPPGLSAGTTGESWRKVTSPHFTILTPAGEATARAWAVELEQFRRGLQAIVPVPAEQLRPVTVVLFKSRRDMDPYLPLENGRPARMGGFFVRADEINTIMLSLAGQKEEVRHTVFHEAVHWHLSAFAGPMPLWLGEGLAEVYATFELTDAHTYTFGNPIDSYVALLRREPLMPLARLFTIGRESLLYNEGTRASIFYAQSWAFVHFLFFGEESPGPEGIAHYLELLSRTRSPDEAFETAFGASYGAIEQRLHDYIRRGRYRKHLYRRSTEDIAAGIVASTADPGTLELARGSLLLGARNPEAAEPYLWHAVALAPSDPRGWELLGHIAVARRDYDAAREVLGRAADAGSANYLVYHNLGVAHFPVSAIPGIGFGAPDPEEMERAAAHYRTAIRLAPAQAGSYEGLAGLMHGMKSFSSVDLELLERGLRLDPANATIEAGIAAGEIRAGRGAAGLARLRRIVERERGGDGRGLEFARKVLSCETLKLRMAEIEAEAKQGRFDAALARVDAALGERWENSERRLLETAQGSLLQFRAVSLAVAAANRGEVDSARAVLRELLSQHPDPPIRADAERILRELQRLEDRRRPRETAAGRVD